jgi:hypothetical protein
MDEAVRKNMIETYLDGGVSVPQQLELGETRPEIGKFLEFVQKYEGVPFRAIWSFGGSDFCFNYHAEFEKFDISGQALAGCMDADTEIIRKTCRKILAAIQESREQSESGNTHLVSRGIGISSTAVRAFILATLDAKERYGNNEIIPELYFLLSQALFPGEPEVEATRLSTELKIRCGVLACAYRFKHGKYPSYRKLANVLDVAPSTISRMFEKREELEAIAETFSSLVDDPGDLA